MDNKKLYKKIGSLFWWVFTILPLVIALIYFIGYHLTFNSGINTAVELSSYHINENGNFIFYLSDVLMDNQYFTFNSYCLPFLNSMFLDLFDTLGVGGSDYLSILFGYMVSIQFYHLFFDFIVWLPNWFHKWLEKVGD